MWVKMKIKRERGESNPYRQFWKLLFYRLNYVPLKKGM